MGDWLADVANWWFAAVALAMGYAAYRVVTSANVVHAVLALVATLGGSAALFLLLGAEFVVWTVVLVYIGAVIVLFLFGIMITRAPLGYEAELDHPPKTKALAAIVAGAMFLLIGWTLVDAFGTEEVTPSVTTVGDIGLQLFGRFVLPFEVVSLVLLAALIGGIVLARQDPVDIEDQR